MSKAILIAKLRNCKPKSGYALSCYKAADAIEELELRIAELERKSDQDDVNILFQAGEISKHLDRIAELELRARELPRKETMNTKEAIALANKVGSDGFDRADVEAMAEALRTFVMLVKEAPHYFHPGYDFDGKKLEWLRRAGLVA